MFRVTPRAVFGCAQVMKQASRMPVRTFVYRIEVARVAAAGDRPTTPQMVQLDDAFRSARAATEEATISMRLLGFMYYGQSPEHLIGGDRDSFHRAHFITHFERQAAA